MIVDDQSTSMSDCTTDMSLQSVVVAGCGVGGGGSGVGVEWESLHYAVFCSMDECLLTDCSSGVVLHLDAGFWIVCFC